MIRFLFRFLGAAALAVAVILAVLDATRTVAAEKLVLTPLAADWMSASPASFAAFEAFVRTEISPSLWNGLASLVLAAPGFSVFLALSLLFFAVGRPRRRRPGRLVFQP